MLTTISRGVRKLHSDEHGMESLQSVVLLALAAIILVLLKGVFDDKIKPDTEGKLDDVMNS